MDCQGWSMVALLLFLWWISILFSIVTASNNISKRAWKFLFLYILADTWYLLSFWGPWLWFWFAFPWWLMMLSIFSCARWPYVMSYCEIYLFSSTVHFLFACLLFRCWVIWVLCIFWVLIHQIYYNIIF